MMFVYLIVFVFSLYLGSFYNVVALRTLSGDSFLKSDDRSECVTCGHELSFADMVPLFSWLFMKGKCRYCGDSISGIYPFGELLTAITYTLLIWKFGFTLEATIHLVFMTVMILATITDLKETIVPDRFVIIGIVLVLALRMYSGNTVGTYIISGLLSFLALLLIMILSGGRMGGADVKLYALIGLTVGTGGALGSLFYASFIGVLHQLPTLIKKKESKPFPFVPYITLGLLATYIVNLYSFLNI